MGESFGHVKRTLIILGQLDRDVVKVRGAFRSKVDNDVEDSSASASNELRLGCRRILKVHAAQSAFLAIISDVCLYDCRLEPVDFELLLAKCACEETSRIFLTIEIDEVGTF